MDIIDVLISVGIEVVDCKGEWRYVPEVLIDLGNIWHELNSRQRQVFIDYFGEGYLKRFFMLDEL